MTQTPRQMRKRGEQNAESAPRTAEQVQGPARRPRRRRKPVRPGLSRSALFAGLIVVFAGGLFAAPFAQYYLGPRLAELSGIADLAAGRADPADFSRLRDIEQRTEQLSNVIGSLARDAQRVRDPRVAALENELNLLREEISGLSALTERTASLENNTANLAALEARLANIEAQPSSGPDVAAVGDRLTSVDETLAAVRDESTQLAATVDALQIKLAEDLKAALALVEDRLVALEQSRPGDPALTETVEALQSRTGALESALDRSVGRAALVASLSTLRATAQSGRPFNTELQTVRALSVTMQVPRLVDPLDRLAVLAETGLPTLVGLQRSFSTLAGRAAQGAPSGDETWVGQTLNRVTSLVTVRRTGEIVGQSAEAVVARTERFLEEGDLARAVAEASILAGQSVEVDGWLSRAQRRLDAERALDDLGTQVLAISGAG
jgi:hypothetical protein